MKKKINIIDILLILLVVAVLAGGYWYLNRDKGDAVVITGKQKLELVVEARNVNPAITDQIAVGDKAVASGRYIDAVVTDVQVTNEKTLDAIDGQLVMLEDPTLRNVVVTFEVNANRYGSYMDIGGQELKVGKTYYIKNDKMHLFGNIVEIKLIEE